MNAITKADLPLETFDADTVHMTFAAAVVKAIAEKQDRVLLVPIERLKPLPGFNVRVKNDEYRQRVSDLADSMVANGYYTHKPLGGLLQDGDSDHLFVHDGEHRIDAIPLANERGASIKVVPVVVAPQGTTVEDLTVSLVQSNTGEPLAPIELAAVVKRLLSYGWDKAEIARRLVKTPRYIDNLLVLAGASAAVRVAVADGKIAAAEAVKLVRKDPKTAGTVIAGLVAQAQKAGKAKATPSTAKKAAGPKMKQVRIEVSLAKGDVFGAAIKEIAKQVRALVDHSKGDDDKLTEDGKIVVIVETLDKTPPKAPKAPKPAKAAKAPVDPDAALAAAPAAKKTATKKPTAAKKAAAPAKKPTAAAKKVAAAKAKAAAKKADAAPPVDPALAHAGLTPETADDGNAGL